MHHYAAKANCIFSFVITDFSPKRDAFKFPGFGAGGIQDFAANFKNSINFFGDHQGKGNAHHVFPETTSHEYHDGNIDYADDYYIEEDEPLHPSIGSFHTNDQNRNALLTPSYPADFGSRPNHESGPFYVLFKHCMLC